MNNDFSVNTNFQTEQFNNSISGFDKNFDKSFKNTINSTNDDQSFEKIFNSMTQNPLTGSAVISIDPNKNKGGSTVEKTVNDIGKSITNSLISLNNAQKEAENDFETFASGGDISIHDVMISAQKSNLSMQMAIQLRNRIINAYNDFKSMNI